MWKVSFLLLASKSLWVIAGKPTPSPLRPQNAQQGPFFPLQLKTKQSTIVFSENVLDLWRQANSNIFSKRSKRRISFYKQFWILVYIRMGRGDEHKNASQRSTSLVCQISENISRGSESGGKCIWCVSLAIALRKGDKNTGQWFCWRIEAASLENQIGLLSWKWKIYYTSFKIFIPQFLDLLWGGIQCSVGLPQIWTGGLFGHLPELKKSTKSFLVEEVWPKYWVTRSPGETHGILAQVNSPVSRKRPDKHKKCPDDKKYSLHHVLHVFA